MTAADAGTGIGLPVSSVVATWLVSAVFGQLSRGHVRVILWGCLRAGRSTTPLGSSA
ncbi:hypothetical protein NQZ68_036969 [Dissostichus eleginoides]|nr:hypothetical protein NQZ68_036969 [Dissostichus eleginoides]